MLVEDDKSLREIYGVRLEAEGYQIISAGDGEVALAMAVKEKPDLIISDVMMPKISGFDMLDIIRATPETKDMKVIMMTALSSEDQRARGEALGANRYLVKSQVGIEDVVRAVHEVLADVPETQTKSTIFDTPVPTEIINNAASPANPTPAPSVAPTAETPVSPPVVTTPPVPETTQTTPAPAAPAPISTLPPEPTPAPQPAPSVAPTAETPVPPPVVPAPAPQPPEATPPVAPVTTSPFATPPTTNELPQPIAPFSSAAPASLGERVIAPLSNDIQSINSQKPDIAAAMAQELGEAPPTTIPPATPTA